ncbi:MAG: hypothetical protein PWQ12_1249 [Clostridiales bacterium]|jgi:uncharacterized membrane protein HdeD (DUF308 family)|nr:hypothetical protein [Clostridiales bacterium]
MLKNSLGGFQVLGLIIALIGISFLAFPTFIGLFAIRAITLIFLILGFYGFIFAFMLRSPFSIFAAFIVLSVAFYAFMNPVDLLFLIGIGFVVSGVNGLIISLKNKHLNDEGALISSVIMILLGVFAFVNAKAALSTVIMILGLIIAILGLVIFFTGKKLSLRNARVFYTYNAHAPHTASYTAPKERVIVNIDNEDVEEAEFKDL